MSSVPTVEPVLEIAAMRRRIPAKPRPGLFEELIDNIAQALCHGAPTV